MGRPLSVEAREKAIGATQALVAEHGIAGFNLDSVVRRSGVAKSTLYRHWGSARELLVHALGCQVPEFTTPNSGSLRIDLEAIVAHALPVLNDPALRRTMLDMLSAAARDPALAELHRTMVEQRRRPIRTVLELAMARGEIPPTDLTLAVDMVEGPFLCRVLLRDDPITPTEADDLVEFALAGLGCR